MYMITHRIDTIQATAIVFNDSMHYAVKRFPLFVGRKRMLAFISANYSMNENLYITHN